MVNSATTRSSDVLVDIKHPALMDSSNHVRTVEAGSGQKAYIIFSDKTSEVSAFLILKDGISKAIANENLPQEFKILKTLDTFNSFLNNAQARGTILSDGEAKLYITQKGLGGSGWGKKINIPSGAGNTYGPPMPAPKNYGVVLSPAERYAISNSTSTSGLGIGVHGSAHSVGSGLTIGTVGVHAGGYNPNGSLAVHATQYMANGQKPDTRVGAGFKINF